jgi:excisionase family DNA binding protein
MLFVRLFLPTKERFMELLTVKEAAKNLRASIVTIRRMIRAGTIPYRRMGTGGKNTRIFFTPEDLAAYLESAAVPARRPGKEAVCDK